MDEELMKDIAVTWRCQCYILHLENLSISKNLKNTIQTIKFFSKELMDVIYGNYFVVTIENGAFFVSKRAKQGNTVELLEFDGLNGYCEPLFVVVTRS